jgi:ubiquinone/menaquinone biosynthesis C-methylase UbiE
MKQLDDDVIAQHLYYEKTADQYDDLHLDADQEHMFALSWLSGLIDYTGAQSILDIGCGTGRALVALKSKHPNLKILGIEPVAALREKAIQKGLTSNEIVNGDALALEFGNDTFDIVCEFGVLHHIRKDHIAVAEMARIAKIGVFISDSNNFGQGGKFARFTKQLLHFFNLWDLFYYLRTKGKGFSQSEGDGIFYSYSVFDSAKILKRKFSRLHFLNTQPSGPSLYRQSPTVAIFATQPGLEQF